MSRYPQLPISSGDISVCRIHLTSWAMDRAWQRVSALRSRHLPLHCHLSIILNPRAEHTDYSSSKFSTSGLIGLAQTSALPPVTASPSSIFLQEYYPPTLCPYIRVNVMTHHFPKGKLQCCFSSSLVSSLFWTLVQHKYWGLGVLGNTILPAEIQGLGRCLFA